jgi:transcriptional regulator with XRE-family HTH domain
VTQGERVKELRKALDLTLEKFGEKLGVTKVAISNIEKGNRNLTEQMAKSICREYSANYEWLTTGEGEMFVESDEEFVDSMLNIMNGGNETRRNLIKALLKADDDTLDAVDKIVDYYMEIRKKKSAETIDTEVEDYRRQLEEEKKAGGESEVSLKDA